MRMRLRNIGFRFRLTRLTLLALLIFVVDAGTNIYTNIEASNDNFAKERDAKLKANLNTDEARRLLAKATAVTDVSIRNSQLMVENNSIAVEKVKKGERDKADLWGESFAQVVGNATSADKEYKSYLASADSTVWDEYNRRVERKKLTSFTGGTTGLAVGVLTPIFSLFLMAMSVKPYDASFRKRCIAGAYSSQFLSSTVSGIAIFMMFDSWFLAIGFGLVLFWCAPLVYEAVARERERLTAEFISKQKDEIAELQKALDEKRDVVQKEQDEIKRRQSRKVVAEKSRVENLIKAANRLVNKQKTDPLSGIPTDPDKAAEWFVRNGEPYGLQIKLAEHCGETKSSFGRRVEQKRLQFAVSSKADGNGKLVAHGIA